MGGRTLEKSQNRERHIRSIFRFLHQDDCEKWPEVQKQMFHEIKRLGVTDYESWCNQDPRDWSETPWKNDLRKQALRISLEARRCDEDSSNEATLRHKLETHMFGSLKMDTSCSECHKKVWRADVEVKVDPKEMIARWLAEDLASRETCKCVRTGAEGVQSFLSPIFDYQLEEGVNYSAEEKELLSKTTEKPDGVWGLRQFPALQALLKRKYEHSPDQQSVEDFLNPTIFNQVKNSLVFPFLVLEAKKAGSSDTFSQMTSQCAFVTRKALLIQDKLRQAADRETKWIAGPLVWILTYKGSHCSVSAAYMNTDINVATPMAIANIWEGLIDSRNGAISIMRIIDYITDWAQHVHLKVIEMLLNQMQPPSSTAREPVSETTPPRRKSVPYREKYDSSPTVAIESPRKSDIVVIKKIQRISTWNSKDAQKTPKSTNKLSVADPLVQFDSLWGSVRDAKFIHSRVIGLYITKATLRDLFEKNGSDEKIKRFSKSLASQMKTENPLLLSQSTLEYLETSWTGTQHRKQIHSPYKIFHVLLTFSAYLTADWEQTRELCYLAVSDEARKMLFDGVAKDIANSPNIERIIIRHRRMVKKLLHFYQNTSIQANLSGCIYRSSLYPELSKAREDASDGVFFEYHHWICEMKAHSKESSRDLVWSLYNNSNVVHTQSSSSIFRLSDHLDEQSTSIEVAKIANPWTTYGISNSEEAVLARSKDSTITAFAGYCLFVIDRSQWGDLIRKLQTKAIQFRYYFITRCWESTSEENFEWNVVFDRRKPRSFSALDRLLSHIEKVLLARDDRLFKEDDRELKEDGNDQFSTEESENGDNSNEPRRFDSEYSVSEDDEDDEEEEDENEEDGDYSEAVSYDETAGLSDLTVDDDEDEDEDESAANTNNEESDSDGYWD